MASGQSDGAEPSPGVTYGRTTNKMVRFSHVWTIDNFSFLLEKQLSSTFWTGCNQEMSWRLDLVPNLADTNYSYAVYLHLLSSSGRTVPVKFSVSLLNDERKPFYTKALNDVCVFSDDNGGFYGFSEFIRKETLFNESNGFLAEDKLTVCCEGSALISSETVSGPMELVDLELAKDFAVLFESQYFSDVTIKVQETEFRVHKAILAARAPLFAAMLEYDAQVRGESCIQISDLDPDVVRELLRFIYSGRASNLERLDARLLPAADKYGMERLKVLCEESLRANLTAETAGSTLLLAEVHSLEDLKKHTLEFISSHMLEVMNTDAWKCVEVAHPLLFSEVCYSVITRCKPPAASAQIECASQQ